MSTNSIRKVMSQSFFTYTVHQNDYLITTYNYNNRQNKLVTYLMYFADTYLGICIYYACVWLTIILLFWQFEVKKQLIIPNLYLCLILFNLYLTIYFFLWLLDDKQVLDQEVKMKDIYSVKDCKHNKYFSPSEQRQLYLIGGDLVTATKYHLPLPKSFLWFQNKGYGIIHYYNKSSGKTTVVIYANEKIDVKVIGIMTFFHTCKYLHKCSILSLSDDVKDSDDNHLSILKLKDKLFLAFKTSLLILSIVLGIIGNINLLKIGSIILLILSTINSYTFLFTNSLRYKINMKIKLARAKIYFKNN